MKYKKTIILMIVALMLTATAVAYVQFNGMFFDTGKAKIEIAELGIIPDSFKVEFDKPLPTNDYQITLQGNSALIEEVWVDNGLLGYGLLSKECYITKRTIIGFEGLCNWKLDLTSMAYGNLGYYPSMFHLKQDYTLKGISDEAYLIDWVVTGKEGKGFIILGR